jgi:hypothetical protein
LGELTEEFVKKQIANVMNRIRGANGFSCVEQYMEHINIQVIKLDIGTEKKDYASKVSDSGLDIEYSSKMYQQLVNEKKEEELKRKTYLSKKRCWDKFLDSIPIKIHDIINNFEIRNQMIERIKKESTSTTKLSPQYKNIYGFCDIKCDYWNMIAELKSPKLFDKVTFEIAEKIRHNKLSPIYWGLVWRDTKTIPSKMLKPVPYREKRNFKHYSLLMATQVPKMIPSWIKNNPKLNLYVIKIIFPGNIDPELFIEYLDSSNQWTRSYRTSTDDGPCCQPIL